MTRSRWAMCAGGLLLACGARVSEHGASTTADGTGGAGTSMPRSGAGGLGSSPTSPATGGAGGAAFAADGGNAGLAPGDGIGASRYASAPDAGTSCTYDHPECNTFASYVDLLEDGKVVHLWYPGDPGCGRCYGGGCDLYGYAREACGVSIRVSACAGPDGSPPCIDTASDSTPHYIDGAGKRWAYASLSATSLAGSLNASTTMVDAQVTLSFWDGGGAHYDLPAHVHLCASVLRLLLPC